MYLKCSWKSIASLLHLKCFPLTNNADRSEQKANDFYPRNDSYLPLVGEFSLWFCYICLMLCSVYPLSVHKSTVFSIITLSYTNRDSKLILDGKLEFLKFNFICPSILTDKENESSHKIINSCLIVIKFAGAHLQLVFNIYTNFQTVLWCSKNLYRGDKIALNLIKISLSDTLLREQSLIRTADFNKIAISTSLVTTFDRFFIELTIQAEEIF